MRSFFILISILFTTILRVDAQDLTEPVRVSIYFGGGSYWIDEQQKEKVKMVVDSLQYIERFEISVHSYTDDIGGADYNEWLSERRSGAAKSVLMDLAIPEHQITLKDFGQFNPIYSNDTWMGRRMNRRVDILFWPVVF
jgi:outer membrane protein OmpA-like peptidoglycan-associated protein